MADATKIQLGVCSVTRNGTDLGHSIGGVTITYTPQYHKTKVDKYGDTLVEEFLVGEELAAEFNLAEFTLANLQVAVPEGTAVGDDSISIGSQAGKRASDNAVAWIFHPIANAAGNRNDDVTIYKGVVTNEIKLEHKNDGEKVIPIKVEALVDEGRSDGNLLGYIGDSIS